MKPSLTDRYVAAALRGVPDKQRTEIGAELRELVGDTVDARIAAGEDPTSAERDALTALGDPARLGAAYLDRPLQLIGPAYYLDWQRLLKLLLSIVVPIVIVVLILVGVISGDDVLPTVLGAIGTGFMVAVQIAFWVTVGFAIAERAGRTDITDEWTPDDLPEVPADPPGASRADLISTLVFVALFAAFLIWQMSSPFTTNFDGEPVRLLSDQVLTVWLPYLVGLLVVEALIAVAVFRRRGWTVGFAAVNVVLQVAWAAPLTWLLVTDRAVNPEFIVRANDLVGANVEIAVRWSALAIIVICAWDAIDGFRKAHRAARWSRDHTTTG